MNKLSAAERADELLAKLRPQIIEAMEKQGPDRTDLTFDEIEGRAASVGDLLSRLLTKEVLQQQPPATAQEEQAARDSFASEAAQIGKRPEELRLTHIPDKPCELSTMRGPVEHAREYLYFPEVKAGVFPPRQTAENSRGPAQPPRAPKPARKSRRG